MKEDEIREELTDILTKLKKGDSDLERLKLRLYGTRQAIQIRAIECAERRLDHESEALQYMQTQTRQTSEDKFLPSSQRAVISVKSLPAMRNGIHKAKGKRTGR